MEGKIEALRAKTDFMIPTLAQKVKCENLAA